MKQASSIMYTIGKVFNIIGIVVCGLLLILPIVMMAMPEEIYNQQRASDFNRLTVDQIKVLGVGVLIGLIIALIVEIVILVLAIYAKKKLNNNTKETAPHIIMIIIGALGGSIFYLIGGILGLVAEEQNE